jgi:hypothetical protein
MYRGQFGKTCCTVTFTTNLRTLVHRSERRGSLRQYRLRATAALVGTIRRTGRIRRRQKEHIHALDESAVVDCELFPKQAVLDPVCKALGIEFTLQPSMAFAEELRHGFYWEDL